MTKAEIIKALENIPDDTPVRVHITPQTQRWGHHPIESVHYVPFIAPYNPVVFIHLKEEYQ